MNKKLLSLLMALVFTFAAPAMTVSADEIIVSIDGVQVDFPGQTPVIVDGRTLVPVRGVFETMGFDVGWNPEERQATLTSVTDIIVITIDSDIFTVNDVDHTLEVPAQIINDSTMLPIRAVLESVGYSLGWEEATRTVLITGTAVDTPPETEAEEVEETQAEEETEEETEAEPVTEAVAATLVGTWYWIGVPYYVLNANGEGTMAGMPIRWTSANGILAICVTPEMCGTECIAPAEWYYVLDGNELTLTSTLFDFMTFTYTRR